MFSLLRFTYFVLACLDCSGYGRRVQTVMSEPMEIGLRARRLPRPLPGEEVLERPHFSSRERSLNSSNTFAPLLLAVHPTAARLQIPAQKLALHDGVPSQPQRHSAPLHLHGASGRATVLESESGTKHARLPTTPFFAKRRNFASREFAHTVPVRSVEPKMQLETMPGVANALAFLPAHVFAPSANGAWVFRVPFLSPTLQDILVALILAAAAKIWIKFWSELARREYLPSTLTRKIIHTGTGPMFVLGWAFFSDSPYAILTACAVPVINLTRLWLASRESTTRSQNSEVVLALSRSGKAGEVAKGPFYYTLVLLLSTVFSFRCLPGAIAVCQMAVGDGLADIIGRRFGKTKWGFVKNKTIEGSAAFLVGAFIASYGMVAGAIAVGYTNLTLQAAVLPLLVISVACTLVELFSVFSQKIIGDLADDNLTVPFFGFVLSAIFLHS
jgi:dolichol kinase